MIDSKTGRKIRLKDPEHEKHTCRNGCPNREACLYEVTESLSTRNTLSLYAKCCNQMGQFCWPRGGGPFGEQARTVILFRIIDSILAEEVTDDGADQAGNP